MINIMEILEIGDRMFFMEQCFGYVIGYAYKDTFTLHYGNDIEWYIETWHGVDGMKDIEALERFG